MSANEFWAGSFGDDYTKRCRVDWIKRIPFWRDIVASTGAQKILEVGCNAGWNLSAIRAVTDNTKTVLHGVEINSAATFEAENLGFYIHRDIKNAVIAVTGRNHAETRLAYDLSFTAGVLIHIDPKSLSAFMRDIVNTSNKYILAIEYFAEQEEEVEYRGHAGKLWKRPYGKLYQDMGLKLIETGKVEEDDGFDNCRWWLLERV